MDCIVRILSNTFDVCGADVLETEVDELIPCPVDFRTRRLSVKRSVVERVIYESAVESDRDEVEYGC